MFSGRLIAYCLILSGAWLLVVDLLTNWLAGRLGLYRMLPQEMVEPMGTTWFVLYFAMDFLFLAAVPTLGYSFLFLVMPFTGVNVGLAAALFAFVLGAVPVLMGLTARVKLPMPLVMFVQLGFLIKLAGSLAIIGYLYIL